MKKQNKPQKKTRVKLQPLTVDQLNLIWNILNKFNVLLAKQVLSMDTAEATRKLTADLEKRLDKETRPYIIRNYLDEDLNLSRKFFEELCELLQSFIDLNGLGNDWNKRRAKTLLRSMESLESYYYRQEITATI